MGNEESWKNSNVANEKPCNKPTVLGMRTHGTSPKRAAPGLPGRVEQAPRRGAHCKGRGGHRKEVAGHGKVVRDDVHSHKPYSAGSPVVHMHAVRFNFGRVCNHALVVARSDRAPHKAIRPSLLLVRQNILVAWVPIMGPRGFEFTRFSFWRKYLAAWASWPRTRSTDAPSSSRCFIRLSASRTYSSSPHPCSTRGCIERCRLLGLHLVSILHVPRDTQPSGENEANLQRSLSLYCSVTFAREALQRPSNLRKLMSFTPAEFTITPVSPSLANRLPAGPSIQFASSSNYITRMATSSSPLSEGWYNNARPSSKEPPSAIMITRAYNLNFPRVGSGLHVRRELHILRKPARIGSHHLPQRGRSI